MRVSDCLLHEDNEFSYAVILAEWGFLDGWAFPWWVGPSKDPWMGI